MDQGYTGLFGCIKDATIEDLGIEKGIVIGKTRAAALVAYVHNRSTIRNCYSKAMVYANADTGALAGVVAGADVQIKNCYNTGAVFAKKFTSSTGGLIGYVGNSSHNFTMENCYNVGNFYGLIGKVGTAENAVARNCYSVGSVSLYRVQENLLSTDTAQIGKDTLINYAPVLGPAYEADSRMLNRGYPVLTWENGPKITEPLLDESLKLNHSLNLASDISINFLVPVSLLEGYDLSTVYVESTVENYAGETFLGTETVRMEPVQKGAYYYFILTGITAVQMNDTVSSVLYGVKDGQPYYSKADLYSVAKYAYSQLDKSLTAAPASLKALCADLLRYGAKAQIYKDYRVSTLADINMTEAHKAYLSDLDTVTFGNNNADLGNLANAPVTWVGKSLELDSKVCLKFIFNTSNYTGALADLRLKVSYKDIYGETMHVTVTEVTAYNLERNQHAFSVDALLASELREVVSVQIYAGESPVSSTLQYSADTYGNNKTGALGELCKALVAYSDSAKNYFNG